VKAVLLSIQKPSLKVKILRDLINSFKFTEKDNITVELSHCDLNSTTLQQILALNENFWKQVTEINLENNI